MISSFRNGKLTKLEEPPRTIVKNIVQNLDGTISALPGLIRSDKEGWWLTDNQVYWQPRLGSGAQQPAHSKEVKPNKKGK